MTGSAAQEVTVSDATQAFELTMAIQRAMLPIALQMTKQARQSWIGMKTPELTRVLSQLVFLTTSKVASFPIWKTIKLGTRPNPAGYRKALKKARVEIGTYADQILTKTGVAAVEGDVDLVRITGAELGFTQAATRAEIYERAFSLGLERCPAEVGPRLREEYLDQPNSDWVLIGMEPIAGSDGDLRVFHLGRGGGGQSWLDADWGRPGHRWSPEGSWVFVLPRK